MQVLKMRIKISGPATFRDLDPRPVNKGCGLSGRGLEDQVHIVLFLKVKDNSSKFFLQWVGREGHLWTSEFCNQICLICYIYLVFFSDSKYLLSLKNVNF